MRTIFLNVLQYCFCFGLFVGGFFFFLAMRREVIALWQGIEPSPLALEGEVLTTDLTHQGSGKSLNKYSTSVMLRRKDKLFMLFYFVLSNVSNLVIHHIHQRLSAGEHWA